VSKSPVLPHLNHGQDNVKRRHFLKMVRNLVLYVYLGSQPLDDSKPLRINIVSREASKPFLTEVARHLAWSERREQKINSDYSTFQLSVPVLEKYLEGSCYITNPTNPLLKSSTGRNGLSPPDFMIIHPVHPSKYNRLPMELHGFPPWQIRLTEI